MIYLDYAATSWPKPKEVTQAIVNFLEQVGGNPGRSGHRTSVEAARILYDTRESIAALFNITDPLRVIFTLNATHAINYALLGLLKPGDKVVTTSIEHNAVMRPLRALEKLGIRLKTVTCKKDSSLDIDELARAVDLDTKLVIINHASNVTGTIQPINEISTTIKKTGALLMVDAAQTAGVVPIDMQLMGIDLMAFTGHKGLLGPTGTGGLIIGNLGFTKFEPVIRGGTGSNSQLEVQPDMLPDKLESGTPNIVGIAGLYAGIEWLKRESIESIRFHEMMLTKALLEGLADIPGVDISGTLNTNQSTAIVSFTVKNKSVSEIGLRLDEEFNILCRVGLHCSPATHITIGTFPDGTIRLAPGVFTSTNDINRTIAAIKKVAKT